jgi:hypothetical protein
MPIRKVPDYPELSYFLLSFSRDGVERNENVDGANSLLSTKLVAELSNSPVTDVFFISHGWKGDEPAAIGQYDRWISAMAMCTGDRQKVGQKHPAFRPLIVGLHWPSLPWGDENISDSGASFSGNERSPIEGIVDNYAECIADTPSAREAFAVIFEAAMDNVAPPELSTEVREAYLVLNRESGLGDDGEGAAPGDDREPFNPDLAYQNSQSLAATFGIISLDGILSPLRQLSFWKMKDRARRFGETGGHQLLRSLQKATKLSGRAVQFHLMGHSFGCIVMSAILRGPDARSLQIEPVHSLFLVQGALSLWSYCDGIPSVPDRSGYFRALISNSMVTGPIVTTFSEHDTAVGTYYPLGAGIGRQVAYGLEELPKYGGVGVFGIRGSGLRIEDKDMVTVDETYDFKPGNVYNLDASEYISKIEGASGAHNDIAHPEVAHAFWEAVMCPEQRNEPARPK